MESLTIFKIAQFIILVTFAVFVSDLRNKKGMIPLINGRLTLAMRLCYPILICIYGYIIATLDLLSPLEFVALAATFLGTLLVVKAKMDLRRHHTWAGYRFETTKLVTEGVYAFIRHPLYTGVYMFILGGLLIGASRFWGLSIGILDAPWFLSRIGSTTLVYVMALLPIIGGRETKLLAQEFGNEFSRYQEQVHAFLPLRRFRR